MTDAILRAEGLTAVYRGRLGRTVRALQHVSVTVEQGKVLGVVGESGSGKSTLARLLVALERPVGGKLWLRDDLVPWDSRPRELLPFRRRVQLVFQNPAASLNPRFRVGNLIAEPLVIHGIGSRAERSERVRSLLELVELEPDIAHRRPSALSGGQRQRVALARALALDPELIVADEPTSALDVSVQAHIVALFARLRQELGLTFVWIAHDLELVGAVADEVYVLYAGRLVEQGPTSSVLTRPRHPYTAALVGAIPPQAPWLRQATPKLPPLSEPADTGCAYAPRCLWTDERCRAAIPPDFPVGPGHRAACWKAGGVPGGEVPGGERPVS